MKTVWMNFHAVFIYENNYKMYNFILNVKCNASKLTKIFRQRKYSYYGLKVSNHMLRLSISEDRIYE